MLHQVEVCHIICPGNGRASGLVQISETLQGIGRDAQLLCLLPLHGLAQLHTQKTNSLAQ